MASRSKWEDMIGELKKNTAAKSAKKKVVEVLKPKEEPKTTGGKGIIEDYYARQKKAMDEY